MKTMTCKQLGGACEKEFHAETWEDMKNQSMKHGHEMAEAKDEDHIAAMGKMSEMMKDPEAMGKWMKEKEGEFEALGKDKQF